VTPKRSTQQEELIMPKDPRQEFIDALLVGDNDKAVSFIHPDCVTRHPPGLPYGGELHGPEGYLQLLNALNDNFELDLEKAEVLMVENDHVLVRYWATMINRTTRNSTTQTVAELYRFENGLCVEQDNYYKAPERVTALMEEAQAQSS
jgi:hypothetical protein